MELLFRVLDSVTILYLIYMAYSFRNHRDKTNERLDKLEKSNEAQIKVNTLLKGNLFGVTDKKYSLVERVRKLENKETLK